MCLMVMAQTNMIHIAIDNVYKKNIKPYPIPEMQMLLDQRAALA